MASRKAEARRWYQQARFDLQAARWNARGAFYNTACFLAQQAAAKALKSLLYAVGARKEALLTHSLSTMIQKAGRQVPALLDCREGARQLDLHYVPSRYPNGLPDGIPHLFYGEATATGAITAAEALVSKVEDYFVSRGCEDILAPLEEGLAPVSLRGPEVIRKIPAISSTA